MELASAREALRGHRAADLREQGFLERMLMLSESAGAWERSHFVPGHFTASAFVLDPEREAVLLIHHKKLGIWVQPGGHIEPSDDTLLAAARRELTEEVGLSEVALLNGGGIVDVDIHVIPARKLEPAHEHFDVRFAFGASSHAFAASAEVADARWVRLDELASIGGDASVLRAASRLARL
ncbi:MAG TPA: NUDIX hydrolase [Polyangiaceae bacterium]|jgi:8-oxo-dGTP pyrophosphatase MutT (NUDIX family)